MRCRQKAVIAALARQLSEAGRLAQLTLGSGQPITCSLFAGLCRTEARNPVNHLGPPLFGDSRVNKPLNGIIRADIVALLRFREPVRLGQTYDDMGRDEFTLGIEKRVGFAERCPRGCGAFRLSRG